MVFLKQYMHIFVSLLLLTLFCLPAVFSLFHTGFFLSDDGEWMIIRLSAFYETLKTGQIPVRFIERLHNGYGYPLANFMYPAYLYIGSLLHILGFSFVASVKIIFAGSMVFSAYFTFFWLHRIFTRIPSYIAAIVYVYTPYHLFDLYGRGSIGEMLGLAVLPFIFWQIERRDIVWTSLGIGLLILSHNSLAFLCMIPLYIYALFRTTNKNWIYRFLITGIPFILGVLLSAFFWIPALHDLQYTVFKSIVISDWNEYFASLQLIGYSSFVMLLFGCGMIWTTYMRISPYRYIFSFFLVLGFLSLFLSLPISTIFWYSIPSSLIQFPFRFLSLLIPSIAFIAAFILSSRSIKTQLVLGGIFIISAFVSSFPYLTPREVVDRGEAYYLSNFSTTTVKDEYMPKWVKKSMPGTEKRIEIITGEGKVEQTVMPFRSFTADIEVEKESLIQVNTVYFPGWKVFLDGKEKEIMYDNSYGLMQFTLSPGSYRLESRFTETPIRLFANSLSCFTLFILLFLFAEQVRYNRRNR